MPTFAPPFGTKRLTLSAFIPPIGGVMIYTFFSSVFITLFLLLGALALYGFLELKRDKYPLGWTCYQHVIILAVIAVICLIAAILFGAQIPECYV